MWYTSRASGEREAEEANEAAKESGAFKARDPRIRGSRRLEPARRLVEALLEVVLLEAREEEPQRQAERAGLAELGVALVPRSPVAVLRSLSSSQRPSTESFKPPDETSGCGEETARLFAALSALWRNGTKPSAKFTPSSSHGKNTLRTSY